MFYLSPTSLVVWICKVAVKERTNILKKWISSKKDTTNEGEYFLQSQT